MNPEKTRLFQGSYFGKIMNNMKLSSRSQFPWNTIFGPVDDPLAEIEGRKAVLYLSLHDKALLKIDMRSFASLYPD